jgi:cytochrome c biogenesis factor
MVVHIMNAINGLGMAATGMILAATCAAVLVIGIALSNSLAQEIDSDLYRR